MSKELHLIKVLPLKTFSLGHATNINRIRIAGVVSVTNLKLKIYLNISNKQMNNNNLPFCKQ